MKKLLVKLFLCILIVCSFCSKSDALKFSKIKIGDAVGRGCTYGYSYCQSLSSTFIYKDNKGNYIVTVSSPENINFVTGIVVFSSNGTLLEVEGVKVISIESVEEFITQPLKNIKKQFGEVPADVGSGQYVPTYIGENATLVSIQGNGFDVSDDNIIEGIVYWDIINNKSTYEKPVRSKLSSNQSFFEKFLSFFK